MLEQLLSKEPASEKKKALSKDYGIVMNNEMERRVNTMCNLSEVVLERGLKEGEELGEERLGNLISALMKENRFDQIELVVEDKQLRKQLYKEYGIE